MIWLYVKRWRPVSVEGNISWDYSCSKNLTIILIVSSPVKWFWCEGCHCVYICFTYSLWSHQWNVWVPFVVGAYVSNSTRVVTAVLVMWNEPIPHVQISVDSDRCSFPSPSLQSPAERANEKPGSGAAGHLISLLLQASAVSPVFWQRDTKSHLTYARTNTNRRRKQAIARRAERGNQKKGYRQEK